MRCPSVYSSPGATKVDARKSLDIASQSIRLFAPSKHTNIYRYCNRKLNVSFLTQKVKRTREGGSQVYIIYTFLNPIASAFSLKACLDMFKPYFRIKPLFFLSPVTRLVSVLISFDFSSLCSCVLKMTRAIVCVCVQSQNPLTIRGSLSRRFVGASARRFREP